MVGSVLDFLQLVSFLPLCVCMCFWELEAVALSPSWGTGSGQRLNILTEVGLCDLLQALSRSVQFPVILWKLWIPQESQGTSESRILKSSCLSRNLELSIHRTSSSWHYFTSSHFLPLLASAGIQFRCQPWLRAVVQMRLTLHFLPWYLKKLGKFGCGPEIYGWAMDLLLCLFSIANEHEPVFPNSLWHQLPFHNVDKSDTAEWLPTLPRVVDFVLPFHEDPRGGSVLFCSTNDCSELLGAGCWDGKQGEKKLFFLWTWTGMGMNSHILYECALQAFNP